MGKATGLLAAWLGLAMLAPMAMADSHVRIGDVSRMLGSDAAGLVSPAQYNALQTCLGHMKGALETTRYVENSAPYGEWDADAAAEVAKIATEMGADVERLIAVWTELEEALRDPVYGLDMSGGIAAWNEGFAPWLEVARQPVRVQFFSLSLLEPVPGWCFTSIDALFDAMERVLEP